MGLDPCLGTGDQGEKYEKKAGDRAVETGMNEGAKKYLQLFFL